MLSLLYYTFRSTELSYLLRASCSKPTFFVTIRSKSKTIAFPFLIRHGLQDFVSSSYWFITTLFMFVVVVDGKV